MPHMNQHGQGGIAFVQATSSLKRAKLLRGFSGLSARARIPFPFFASIPRLSYPNERPTLKPAHVAWLRSRHRGIALGRRVAAWLLLQCPKLKRLSRDAAILRKAALGCTIRSTTVRKRAFAKLAACLPPSDRKLLASLTRESRTRSWRRPRWPSTHASPPPRPRAASG